MGVFLHGREKEGVAAEPQVVHVRRALAHARRYSSRFVCLFVCLAVYMRAHSSPDGHAHGHGRDGLERDDAEEDEEARELLPEVGQPVDQCAQHQRADEVEGQLAEELRIGRERAWRKKMVDCTFRMNQDPTDRRTPPIVK